MSDKNNNPQMAPGAIGWNEVITPNKEATIEFYTKLFGWTTEDMELPGGMTYTMFKNGETPAAGCVVPPEDSSPPMWLSYVNVEDLDASIEQSKALGATILKERVDLPMGSFAIIADPHGATLAFWQMNPDAADC